MTSMEIAEHLVDVFCERTDHEDDTAACVQPHPISNGMFTAVHFLDWTLWNDEDDNGAPEDGETFESALLWAEGNLRRLRDAIDALTGDSQ